MKRNKWLIIIIGVLLIAGVALICIFRPMTMNDIYSKPHFTGTVLQVHDKAILVAVDEGEDELSSSDKISVPLETELKDASLHCEVGDHIKVYYDGTLMETYPAQVHTMYAFFQID